MESTGTCCISPDCTSTTSFGPAKNLFLLLLTTLYSDYCSIPPIYPSDGYTNDCNTDFDFIIVGAGTAGCVIANRLTEVESWDVLLIEAGPAPPMESAFPPLWLTFRNSAYIWNYVQDKNSDACQGFVNRTCTFYKGKCLGGSSSVNGMLYVRGNEGDFNYWASLGNTGWSYDDVLPYFIKMETAIAPGLDPAIHGKNGPVVISEYNNSVSPYPAEIDEVVIGAFESLKFNFIPDLTSNTRNGVTDSLFFVGNGTRSSSAESYLPVLRGRSNFVLWENTLVTRILYDNTGKTANGVEVFRDGVYRNVRCKKEVILCAGALNSPQLLMLSGIGPSDHLQPLGIPVLSNLPVGYNLHDQMSLPLIFAVQPSVNGSGTTSPSQNDMFFEYLTRRLYLNYPNYGVQGFITTPNKLNITPNFQINIIPFVANDSNALLLAEGLGYNQDIVRQVYQRLEYNPALMLLPVMLQPASRGVLKLKSKSPFDTPEFYNVYLSDPADVTTMVQCMDFLDELRNTSSFNGFASFQPNVAECDGLVNETAKRECFVRNIASPWYHHVGSCKMGPQNDSSAVVDPRLRVYGVKGLRVIDASIFPRIPSGNPCGSVLMTGEKGSDIIKEDYGIQITT